MIDWNKLDIEFNMLLTSIFAKKKKKKKDLKKLLLAVWAMCFSATIKGVLDTARFLLDMNHLHGHKSNLI